MSVLVGKPAPDFTVPAVLDDGTIVDTFTLSKDLEKSYGLVFFYPLDFTFVCPSELIALDNRIEAFRERNVRVVGVSVDSHYTHNAWRNTPVDKGGIGPVRFTLAADLQRSIVRDYDVEADDGTAYRGAFIIDTEGIVRAQIVNDHPLGRNIDEILRTIDALQFTEQHGEVCPAGWQNGKAGMTASPEGVAKYLAQEAKAL